MNTRETWPKNSKMCENLFLKYNLQFVFTIDIGEILGERPRICPTRAEGARTSKGVRGHAPRKILKNRVYLMPFPAFWCGLLCMEQVTNEKKILRLVKQNLNRKIARLLSKNCPTN